MVSEAHRPDTLPERQKGDARQGAGRTSRLGRLLIATALVAALAAGGAYTYLRSHRTTPLDEKDTIILADFRNSTGDPVFAGALTQALAIQLEQSPFLALISE